MLSVRKFSWRANHTIMFKNFDFTHLLPTFTVEEMHDIKNYYAFSQEHEKEITEKFNKEFESHPVFGPLLKSIPKELQEANNKENNRLLRLAIFENDWEPYLKSLLLQGVQYAHMGLDFKSWYELIGVVRKYYEPIWKEIDKTDPERVSSLRNGTNIFFDYIMCIIGESFLAEKNFIISKQNKKQETIIKELESFAYIISHDLKTPLRGVASISDWLIQDYSDKLDETGKEYLDLLKSRVVRLEGLIDGVLVYSRAGNVDADAEMIDFNILLKEIIEMVAAPENVHIHLDTKLPSLQIVKAPMLQVFSNLIGNAIKHNDKATVEINVGCIDKNEEWWFYVKDNGPGIGDEFHEKVFKIFQTLKTKDEMNSTGIGLSVVKKIIEALGGKIWIESKPGEGTTFLFTLKK